MKMFKKKRKGKPLSFVSSSSSSGLVYTHRKNEEKNCIYFRSPGIKTSYPFKLFFYQVVASFS